MIVAGGSDVEAGQAAERAVVLTIWVGFIKTVTRFSLYPLFTRPPYRYHPFSSETFHYR